MDSYENKHNQHQVYLERLATHLYNSQSEPSLDAAYKAARLILLEHDSITSLTQLNKITASVNAQVRPIITESWSAVTGELAETAAYESNYYQGMFEDTQDITLAPVADAKVVQVATNSLMTLTSGNSVKSDVWANYTKANAGSVVDTYNAQIRAGFSNDETLFQITKRLRTVNDNLLKRNAETLVRTSMNHYADKSRETLMQANKDIVPNKYYNTVFDNRTTRICMSNSGKVFAIDDPKAPPIPAHFNCRSNWLYLTEGQTEPSGTRAAVGGQKGEAAEEAFERREQALESRRNSDKITGTTTSQVKYRGRKDSNVFKAGQISGKTSMDNFMLKQPNWFIDDSLGKGTADLFREGKISLKDLTDANNRPLTLAELKASGV